MAYSEEPDRTETYEKYGSECDLVVNFYDEFPGTVNWHESWPDGVGNADTCDLAEIRKRIKEEGWILKNKKELFLKELNSIIGLCEAMVETHEEELGRTVVGLIGRANDFLQMARHSVNIWKD